MKVGDWAWWCASAGARSPAEKEFAKFPDDVRGAFFDLMKGWLDGSVTPAGQACASYGRHGIMYLRHRKGNNPYRVYFVVDGAKAVIIHAAYKNQRKIDRKSQALLKERATSGTSKPFA